MNYLYHYTSLESLALILKNRTLRFNNLLYVDDAEEAATADMGNFGKYCYASCWTDLERESIPFWGLYTPEMRGVRIRIKRYPFRLFHFEKGEYSLSESIDTFIDYEKIYNDNCARIVPNQPRLIKVQYSDNDEDLNPYVRQESIPGIAQMYIAGNMPTAINATISYSLDKIGRWKRSDWKFQSEWRYVISLAPMGMHEEAPKGSDINRELIRRLEDQETRPPYKYLTLPLAENAFEDMEVVYGPKMSEGESVLADALLARYAPSATHRTSRLIIR